MLSAFCALRTLFAYLVLSVLMAGCFFWLLPFVENEDDGNYAFNVWYAIDVAICSVAHGTRNRTISGWTGEYATKKKRYEYQAWVIDCLAFLCGDGKNHCERAYFWEKSQGFVR